MVLEFYKLLRLPQNWILKWVVVFSTSIVAVWIWSKAKEKGKACLTGLISLILVFCLSVSVVSYKGILMKPQNVSLPVAESKGSFEGKEELEELM